MKRPTIVLGLCIGEFCAAALAVDGVVVGASYEERFHRKKCYSGFPYRALQHLLRVNGVEPGQVDLVAVMNQTGAALAEGLVQRMHGFSVEDFVREARHYWHPRLYEGKAVRYLDVFHDRIDRDQYPADVTERLLREGETADNTQAIRAELIVRALGRRDVPIRFVEHHRSHALYALMFAPPDAGRTLIFTADSFGDYSNSNVYLAADGRLKTLFSSAAHNLGHLYRNITLLLGMKPYQHEYKVMGLAPYASEAHAKQARDVFASYMSDFDGEWRFLAKPKDHYFQFQRELEGIRFDNIAGGLQMYFEEMLLKWFRWFLDRTPGVDSVVFGGGLSMNVKVNMRIDALCAERGLRFYPAPSGDDYSHAISAIPAALMNEDDRLPEAARPGSLGRLDLGYEFSDADRTHVRDWARKHGWEIRAADPSRIAEALKADRILALCDGRAEFGARALGFRSIIANPSRFDTIRRINLAIKQRDFWMPFAPAVLAGKETDYLDVRDPMAHRFMASSAHATALGQQALSAALHPYDQTGRPQIASRQANPLYADIIEAFGRATGIYAVLNTSLNLHGYPIVNDAEDLIFVLSNSQLDGCILRDCLLIRPDG